MQATRGTCQVVVGAQWGDEGKGKIVDVLAERADVVARYQGGANAGHTVVVEGEEFILHQVPSGVLHRGKECLLGNGVVLDAGEFFREIDLLEERGIDAEARVWVSNRAHLLLPWHKALDAAKEGSRGTRAIGTTGRGIGPAYEDKVGRVGIRVADCLEGGRLRDLVEEGAEAKRAALALLDSNAEVTVEGTLAEIEGWRERLLARSADVSQRVADHIAAGRRVLLEGAQGSQLDIDHGTYPYVTSSSTTAGGSVIGIGLGPKFMDDIIGVVKAYTTRVGNGPLPTEVESPLQERLREIGPIKLVDDEQLGRRRIEREDEADRIHQDAFPAVGYDHRRDRAVFGRGGHSGPARQRPIVDTAPAWSSRSQAAACSGRRRTALPR